MTNIIQKQELQNKIWKIANDVRGSVDGWDFKHFVLGALFYRFISENFTNYIEGGDAVSYTHLDVYKRQATRRPNTLKNSSFR